MFDDANLDKAVEGAMASKFRNTGQTCVREPFPGTESIHDAFVEKFKVAIEAMKVGDGFEEGVSQAALINRGASDKVMEHLEDALGKGARVITGGQRHERGGSFVQPTLITGVSTDAQLCQDETFGPLAAIIPFKTEEDAIRIANDTIRAGSVLLQRQYPPLLARGRSTGKRHGRRQRRADFQCHRTVWRGQGIRPGPRRLPPGHGRVSGNEISVHGKLKRSANVEATTRGIVYAYLELAHNVMRDDKTRTQLLFSAF